jgi:hypothetical protein
VTRRRRERLADACRRTPADFDVAISCCLSPNKLGKSRTNGVGSSAKFTGERELRFAPLQRLKFGASSDAARRSDAGLKVKLPATEVGGYFRCAVSPDCNSKKKAVRNCPLSRSLNLGEKELLFAPAGRMSEMGRRLSLGERELPFAQFQRRRADRQTGRNSGPKAGGYWAAGHCGTRQKSVPPACLVVAYRPFFS